MRECLAQPGDAARLGSGAGQCMLRPARGAERRVLQDPLAPRLRGRALGPRRNHAPFTRILGEGLLHDAHAGHTIDERMVHLGVEREAVVLQALDDVALPQRA